MEELKKRLSTSELTAIVQKQQVSFAKKGMFIAMLGAILWGVYGVIMGQAYLYEPFSGLVYSGFVVAICAGCIQESLSSIFMAIRNISTGKIKEYGRIIRSKPGKVIMLGAIAGGPAAVTLSMLGIMYCGSAFALAIGAMSPVFASLFGVIFLKEKTNIRFWLGLALVVIGGIVTSFVAPDPSQYPYFYLGIVCSFMSALLWGLESFTGTKGTDCVDAEAGVGVRYLTSMCCYIILMIVCGGFNFIIDAFVNGTGLLFAFFAVLIGTIGVMYWYVSFNMTGCTRAAAINSTYGLWNIAFALILTAFGVVQTLVTTNLIIGSVMIVLGIFLVLANPKDLLELRK